MLACVWLYLDAAEALQTHQARFLGQFHMPHLMAFNVGMVKHTTRLHPLNCRITGSQTVLSFGQNTLGNKGLDTKPPFKGLEANNIKPLWQPAQSSTITNPQNLQVVFRDQHEHTYLSYKKKVNKYKTQFLTPEHPNCIPLPTYLISQSIDSMISCMSVYACIILQFHFIHTNTKLVVHLFFCSFGKRRGKPRLMSSIRIFICALLEYIGKVCVCVSYVVVVDIG